MTLKTELADSRYVGMTDDEAAADLNTPRIARNRTSMSGREVAAGIDNGEYDALSDVRKSQVLALIASDNIDPFGFAANVVKDIFGAGTTLTNLAAARVEQISRATELGLSTVKVGHVEEARRGN